MRLLVQQHLLLSIPGQIEHIRLQLLCPLRLFNAVRVQVQNGLLYGCKHGSSCVSSATPPVNTRPSSHWRAITPRPGLAFEYACLSERRSVVAS